MKTMGASVASPENGRRSVTRGATRRAGLVYGVLAIIATWPLAANLGTHAPGAELWQGRPLFCETPVNLWNLWWFRHAVERGWSPFETTLLFYPHGASLWYHTLAPLHGFAGTLLQVLFPLVATFNLIVLLSLVLSALAVRALALELGLEGRGSLLAGGVFAFSPALFRHLYVGHLELMAAYWMPAALLLALRIARRERPYVRDGFWLGLVLLGAAYTSPYYAVYAVELLAVAIPFLWRGLVRPRARACLAVAGGTSLLGLSPMLVAFAARSAPSGPTVGFAAYSGDLVGFLVPSFTNPLFGRLATPVQERLAASLPLALPQETTTSVGLVVLGLAVLGALRSRRLGVAVRLPLAIVVVFGLLTLGGRLRVLGWDTGLPLPAALLADVPLWHLARAPGRHILLVMVGLGVLAGIGLQSLRRGCWRAAVVALLALEYLAAPIPLYPVAAHDVYWRLAAEPGRFAVLELPFGLRDGSLSLGQPDSRQILDQTVHEHPILTGMISRLPASTIEAILQAPVVGTLLHPQGATRQAFARDLRAGPSYFAKWNIKAVVVHPSARGGGQERYLERILTVTRHEDFADGTRLLWVDTSGASARPASVPSESPAR